MVITGAYNSFLVALSILIAIFASFTALDIAGRIRVSAGRTRWIWTCAASVALGGGIWSMHFVAMLAFSLPSVRMGYNLWLTLLSLVLAIIFTGGGFTIMGWRRPFRTRTVAAGLLMGCGVLAMHYLGMSAMQLGATVSYDRIWVAASVLIAIGAATTAVWLASRDQQMAQKVVAAILMGGAISGMHYAGMRAAIFEHVAPNDAPGGLATVGQTYLAIAISAITALILLLALASARLERLFHDLARREARIEMRLRVADILRNGSSLESLHEIAALMGEHFKVTRTGYGQLDPVEDIFTYDVCWTEGQTPPLLGRFPAAAFGVKIVAALKAGDTVAVEDLLAADLSDEARTRETAREVDTRSILVVPFVRNGRLQTIVYLNDRSPRQWHADDISFMEELAERTRLVIERETVEAALRELNATLEARVEVRTAELRLAQEALLQSQKMEAIGQLVSGLAHDFNNVLGAVVGSFDLIERRAEDPERVRRLAGAGLQAAERGSKLTSQLLAFSRSQSIELRPLLVCDVIDDIRDMLARTLGPMIVLDLDLNPTPAAVLADPTQVEMMILNLAINARDAMPSGGSLTISTRVRHVAGDGELADGDYVIVSVRDTGVGMDEVTLRRAMEPFFTTKPVGKGTGLGLAQIYGSARQSGGAVRIESAPGAGTTVHVFLPCTHLSPARADGDRADINDAPMAPLKVLIVDDDQDHRSMLLKGVEALGHIASEAQDGPSALSALEIATPDVLLLDYAMPGMNGAEMAREVRRRWASLPIIFTSGLADTDAIHALEGESVSFLRKPFRLNALQRTIRQALEPREGRD
ncbi:MHYT domain-containing protein [Phenylobacterium immobile]|uniref:MHYT domain-containing protein n=1 Tax=Phenylobacterium immobile TaxID=21 RepID=UPI000A870486|nr:MHYT domain-containing protein [Phenylobacterium immobile]